MAGPRRLDLAEGPWLRELTAYDVVMLRCSDPSRDVVACGIFPLPFERGVRCGDGSVALVVVAHRCISRTCRYVRRTQFGHGRCEGLLLAPSGSSQWSASTEGLWH